MTLTMLTFISLLPRIRSSLLILLALSYSIILSTASYAEEIYKWKDKSGNVHYGQHLPENAKQQIITHRVNVYTPDKQRATQQPASKTPKVIMYSTARCGYCKKARSFMRKHQIAFTEYDVDKSIAAEREYQALGGRGVPFILIGDAKVRGFNPQKITQLYTKALNSEN